MKSWSPRIRRLSLHNHTSQRPIIRILLLTYSIFNYSGSMSLIETISHSLLAYVHRKAAINDFAVKLLRMLGFEESG